MDLKKELLADYLFVVAVNLGEMNDDIGKKIKEYDNATYSDLLNKRILEQREKLKNPDLTIIDTDYYNERIKTLEQVKSNLNTILSSTYIETN